MKTERKLEYYYSVEWCLILFCSSSSSIYYTREREKTNAY